MPDQCVGFFYALFKTLFVFIWSVLMRRVFYLYLYIPKGIYKYK